MRKGWGDLASAFREASDAAGQGATDAAASRAARLEEGRAAREELLTDLVEFGQAVGVDVSRDDEYAIIWTAGGRSVRFRAMGAGDRVGVEFRALTSREGRIYREQLLDEVWGSDITVTTRTIDTHLKRLREKLGECGSLIETVRSVGYRLAE